MFSRNGLDFGGNPGMILSLLSTGKVVLVQEHCMLSILQYKPCPKLASVRINDKLTSMGLGLAAVEMYIKYCPWVLTGGRCLIQRHKQKFAAGGGGESPHKLNPTKIMSDDILGSGSEIANTIGEDHSETPFFPLFRIRSQRSLCLFARCCARALPPLWPCFASWQSIRIK